MSRSLYTGIYAIQPPKHIKKAIRSIGGTNPYGEPMYRVVRTEGRKQLVGGLWRTWPEGTPTSLRNPDDPNCRPLSSIPDVRPVPMYPGDHSWILEKWRPASKWGTREQFYSPEGQGGTMIWCQGQWLPGAGQYPERGDYYEANFYFENSELSELACVTAIGMIETGQSMIPADPMERARLATSMAEDREKQQDKDFDHYAAEVLGAEDDPLSVYTPGARAEACRFAESIGIRNHPF
ncbi:MAG: hypothetical protein M3O09_09625 [Acidobacteriota bacterium]|nr:hypothetical protein [Acidobacteriota bacterium]